MSAEAIPLPQRTGFPEKSIIIGAPAVPRKDFIKQLQTMKRAEELIKKFKKYEQMFHIVRQDKRPQGL